MHCSVKNLSQLRTKCGPLWLSDLKHVHFQPLTKLVMIGSSGDSISIESMILISASTLVQNIVGQLDTSLDLQVAFPDFSMDILVQLRKLLSEGISDNISRSQADELRTLWKVLDVKTSVNFDIPETVIKIEIETVANEEEIDHCPTSPVISMSTNNIINEENTNQSIDMFEDCEIHNIRSEAELTDNGLIDREELVVTPIKQIIPQVNWRKAQVELRQVKSSNIYTQETTDKGVDMKKSSGDITKVRSRNRYTRKETQSKKTIED